jgi:hypothetical protein
VIFVVPDICWKNLEGHRDGMRQLKSNAERDAPVVKDEGNALPLKAQLESFPVTYVAETEAAMEEAKAKVNGV